MPVGGVVTLSASRVRDKDGSIRLQVSTDHGSIQTWPNWLAISFDSLQVAERAWQRLPEEASEGADVATATVLVQEYQAALQTISAAVFALDAFYGVISRMVTVPEQEKIARQTRNDGRAVWVADAVIRASAGMPNGTRQAITEGIHKAYKARDLAVHPPHIPEPLAVHPRLENAQVPKRWIDYSFESSMKLMYWCVEAMRWPVDHPQPRNASLTTWAPIASRILHKIVDPFTELDTSSPLSLRRPA
jgi:hypothetical protein